VLAVVNPCSHQPLRRYHPPLRHLVHMLYQQRGRTRYPDLGIARGRLQPLRHVWLVLLRQPLPKGPLERVQYRIEW
jgi:hypothetical protein